jgi:hypothetical protein
MKLTTNQFHEAALLLRSGQRQSDRQATLNRLERTEMKRNVGLGLFLFIALICPQLGACTEVKSSYFIQDTGLHAERGIGFVWLDDHRVRFYGHREIHIDTGDLHNTPRKIGAGYYIWDTDRKEIVADPSLEGAMRLCVRGDYITFIRKSATDEKESLLVIRDKGQETVTRLVNIEWFNRFSCRYYNEKPEWISPNHKTLPLFDGDGFLDWFPTEGPDSVRNNPLRFRSDGKREWVELPIGTREVWHSLVNYAPFKRSYLLYPMTYIEPMTGKEEPIGPWPKEKPVRIWWLSPKGTVTTETVPYMPFMRGGSRGYFPAKTGIFIYTHKTDGLGKPGDAGGYLARNGRVTKLITGLLDDVSVSPDGCRVASIHDPYDTVHGIERLNRINVKVINVCEEVTHAR